MSGIEKQIDKLGRIVLPKSYRDKLGLCSNDKVLLSLENSVITISVKENLCALCAKRLQSPQEIRLCEACIARVKKISQK